MLFEIPKNQVESCPGREKSAQSKCNKALDPFISFWRKSKIPSGNVRYTDDCSQNWKHCHPHPVREGFCGIQAAVIVIDDSALG